MSIRPKADLKLKALRCWKAHVLIDVLFDMTQLISRNNAKSHHANNTNCQWKLE